MVCLIISFQNYCVVIFVNIESKTYNHYFIPTFNYSNFSAPHSDLLSALSKVLLATVQHHHMVNLSNSVNSVQIVFSAPATMFHNDSIIIVIFDFFSLIGLKLISDS